jgi:hypothetical protein
MANIVEGTFNVCIYHPFLPFVRSSQIVDAGDGIMARASWPESV